MSKHTPGPWSAEHWAGKWYVVDHIDISVASISRDSEANANLIAAAPDLLEALEGLLVTAENFGVGSSSDSHAAAIQAIARAKGESQ